MNPFILISSVALVLQSIMLVLFYSLPDPLGLSLTEMFSGKTIWQISMLLALFLVLSSIFAFLKTSFARYLFSFYFLIAVVDYEVFDSTSDYLTLYALISYTNITDSTTISTLGGDLKGTILWLMIMLITVVSAITFVVYYTKKKTKLAQTLKKSSLKLPIVLGSVGLILSVIPLVLF